MTQEIELIELIKEFREFRDQYETDMRGDKKLNNGNNGVIGELRILKERFERYPSLTWLFATKPIQTIATVLAVYIFISALYTVGLIRFFGAMLGIDFPTP